MSPSSRISRYTNWFAGHNIPPFESVGCYKDDYAIKGNRPLPSLLLNKVIQWNNKTWLASFIELCAEAAYRWHYRYFAVQNFKECFSGANGSTTYNRDGQYIGSLDLSGKRGCYYGCCTKRGVGWGHTNYVYRFVAGTKLLILPFSPLLVISNDIFSPWIYE